MSLIEAVAGAIPVWKPERAGSGKLYTTCRGFAPDAAEENMANYLLKIDCTRDVPDTIFSVFCRELSIFSAMRDESDYGC